MLLLLGITIIPTINAGIKTIDENSDIRQLSSNGDLQTYKLLIIAPEQFENELNRLVEHKEKFGVSTHLVTVDEVYEEMYRDGRDPAEKIKYYIKGAIETWGIEYVLLVGGKKGQSNRWYLPPRYVNMDNDWESVILSDMYFADIYDSEGNFSSWDSDGDGVYGEWYYEDQPEDKYMDLIPDVAVGRLPCRYSLEVRIMVNKIIYYEKKTYNKPWFKDMVAIAGDTYLEQLDPRWVGNEGEYYADMALENMTGFNPIKLYASLGYLKQWEEIGNALSKGCGFVYFVGHGSPMTWATHFPNDKNWTASYGIYQIPRLRNWLKYSICVVSGCHNSQFDVSIFKYFNETARRHLEYAFECWSWMMTRKIGGGSVATIGCTALGHTKEDKPNAFAGGINELEVEFFRQYGQNDVDIIGDTWAAALTWYAETYPVDWNTELTKESWVDVQVAETWALFGDPSLKIGGYPPQ